MWCWPFACDFFVALCGGLEKYDSLEDVGWSAQEKRRIKGNSLPRTPELIRRRLPSSSFSFEPKASSLPRNRSQSDVLTIPTLKTRSRSCEVVRNIGLCSNGSVETVQDGIRTTTLWWKRLKRTHTAWGGTRKYVNTNVPRNQCLVLLVFLFWISLFPRDYNVSSISGNLIWLEAIKKLKKTRRKMIILTTQYPRSTVWRVIGIFMMRCKTLYENKISEVLKPSYWFLVVLTRVVEK